MIGFKITEDKAIYFIDIVLKWHSGYSAVRLEDGNYFIREEAYFNLPDEYLKNVDGVDINVKNELDKIELSDVIIKQKERLNGNEFF